MKTFLTFILMMVSIVVSAQKDQEFNGGRELTAFPEAMGTYWYMDGYTKAFTPKIVVDAQTVTIGDTTYSIIFTDRFKLGGKLIGVNYTYILTKLTPDEIAKEINTVTMVERKGVFRVLGKKEKPIQSDAELEIRVIDGNECLVVVSTPTPYALEPNWQRLPTLYRNKQ
jgi:hypothetical protein